MSRRFDRAAVAQPSHASERDADRRAARALADTRDRHHPFADTGDRAPRRPEWLPTGSGRPLPDLVRTDFESRFGADFSDVRIHDGPGAAARAAALGARAYTVGSDIVFGAGNMSFDGPSRRLLAHELAHVSAPAAANAPVVHRQLADEAPVLTTESVGQDSLPSLPSILVPDGTEPGPGQMQETAFLERVRERLDIVGAQMLAEEELPGDPAEPEIGLGSLYVEGIRNQSQTTGQSIENLISQTLQMSCATADFCLEQLEAAVPAIIERNRATFDELLKPTLDQWAGIQADLAANTHPVDPNDADLDWRVDEGWADEAPPEVMETNEAAVFSPTPSANDIQSEFPEISTPLALGLTGIPNSIWGFLKPMLQGQIFHSIISAGYIAGRPAPAHPLALVNVSGPGLFSAPRSYRRTDLRDPVTGAVIEIKPAGDVGGAAQLAGYVQSLIPPPAWHAALDVPHEAWPPTGAMARYTLNPFLINLTLEAWNNFAAEPGMLYYQLNTTPGLPVYVPRHVPQPSRRFAFEIPRLSLPDFHWPTLPTISPEVIAGTAAVGFAAIAVYALIILAL